MRAIDADALYKKLNDIRKEEVLLHGRLNNENCCTLSTALYEIDNAPTIEPEIIRCKDCKWWGYDDDDGVVRVCHAAKHGYRSPNWDIMIYRKHKGDFYCSDAERRTDAV